MRTAWFGKLHLLEETAMATESVQSPLALRPQEAANALRISPRKLWSMTASGEIPHIRLGRCVRYPVDDLQRWIDQQTKGGNA